MRLNQLEYLMALRKFGSISKAADALYVSQPAVSRGVRGLEQELNCQLILRTNRGTTFTPKGLEILESATLIMNEVQHIKETARTTVFADNHMTIAGPTHFASHALIPLVTEYNKKGTNFVCDMRIGSGPILMEQLLKRTLDFGLIYLDSISARAYDEAQEKGFCFLPLIEEPLLLGCRYEHPLSGKTVFSDDLLDYPFVSMYDLVRSPLIDFFQSRGYSKKMIKIFEPGSARSLIANSDSLAPTSLVALLVGNLTYPFPIDHLILEDFHWNLTLALCYHQSIDGKIAQTIAKRVVDATKQLFKTQSEFSDKTGALTYLYPPK